VKRDCVLPAFQKTPVIETCVCEKRLVKETYRCEKRPIYLKRDLRVLSSTPVHFLQALLREDVQTDLWKKSPCVNRKRPVKETYICEQKETCKRDIRM